MTRQDDNTILRLAWRYLNMSHAKARRMDQFVGSSKTCDYKGIPFSSFKGTYCEFAHIKRAWATGLHPHRRAAEGLNPAERGTNHHVRLLSYFAQSPNWVLCLTASGTAGQLDSVAVHVWARHVQKIRPKANSFCLPIHGFSEIRKTRIHCTE